MKVAAQSCRVCTKMPQKCNFPVLLTPPTFIEREVYLSFFVRLLPLANSVILSLFVQNNSMFVIGTIYHIYRESCETTELSKLLTSCLAAVKNMLLSTL